MNNDQEFTFTGQVKKFGIQGKQFPKLWIAMTLPDAGYNGVMIQGNSVFVQVRMGTKAADMLHSKLEVGKYILVQSAIITDIKRSRKVEGTDEWEQYTETGVQGRANAIYLSDRPYPEINFGSARGKVTTHKGNKINIVESYMYPSKDGGPMVKGTRNIPVLLETDNTLGDLTNRVVYVIGEVSGKTPEGKAKVFVVASPAIVLY